MAADALPRSVLQVAPPPSLKASLMAEVRRSGGGRPSRAAGAGDLLPGLRRDAPAGGLGQRRVPARRRHRLRLGLTQLTDPTTRA